MKENQSSETCEMCALFWLFRVLVATGMSMEVSN